MIDDTYFSNPKENENNDSTYHSHTDNKDSVTKINVDKDEDKDDEYKEDNSEAPKSDGIVTNKTEVEKEFTDCLMPMNFLIRAIQYMISTIIPCDKNMIELENIYIYINKISMVIL